VAHQVAAYWATPPSYAKDGRFVKLPLALTALHYERLADAEQHPLGVPALTAVS
jgi:hypothetical protein